MAPESAPHAKPESAIRPVAPELDLTQLLLGKYRVLSEVGRGGMADVYLAIAHGLRGFNKLVVLKVIRAEVAEDSDARNMFVDEARLAGRLNHANVVHTLEVGEDTGRPILVMEHLDGQPLSSVLRRCQRTHVTFPVKIALRVLAEALQGLHYAHMLKDFDGSPLNLVHRDVSPQNIFLTYDGQVKMLDFGIAKAAITSSETRAGMMKGKAAFIAPEQVNGQPQDHRADIYSAGVVLWEVLTGQQWWKGKSQGQILLATVDGDIPKPSSVCAGVGEDLEAICVKALAVKPDERYQTALEMLEAIEAAIDARGGLSARDVGAFVAGLFEDEREMLCRTLETELRSLSEPRSCASVKSLMADTCSVNDSQGSIRSVNTDAILMGSEGGPDASNRNRRTLVFVLSASALLALAGIGALVLSAAGQSNGIAASAAPTVDAAHDAPASTASPASMASAEPVASCRFSIGAAPNHAAIFLDDKDLEGNPVEVDVPCDGKAYAVRAQAAGYRARTVEVMADRDATFAVKLDRIHAGGQPASKQPKKVESDPSTPPPPPSAPLPPPTQEEPPQQDPKSARDRIQDLDTSSPW